MAVEYLVNAAPLVINYGIDDQSTRIVPKEEEPIPQFLPKWFIYAQKGPNTPQLLGSAEAEQVYGSSTFDLRGTYANHVTPFVNGVRSLGNKCMYQRITPDDAKRANFMFWLDVLETKIDVYQRNDDGSVKLSVTGEPLTTGQQINGYKVKWVVNSVSTETDVTKLSSKLQRLQGDQTDGVNVSQRFPLFGLIGSSANAYTNNSGLRIWVPTTATGQVPTKLMAEERVYPFFVNLVRRKDYRSQAVVIKTILQERDLLTCFKPETVDPSTDRQVYIGDNLLSSYHNTVDSRYGYTYGDFGTLVLYQENIDYVTKMFHTAEIPYIDQHSDFSNSPFDHYLFNMISGVSSDNTPYHSFRLVDGTGSVRLNQFTNIFAACGSDGTMSFEGHASKVDGYLDEYTDESSELNDIIVNCESDFIDSGYPVTTKEKLFNVMALRKDTFVAVSTYVAGGKVLTPDEELSLSIMLKTRAQNYLESEFFGTPTARATIMGGSQLLRNSRWNKRVPLTYDLAMAESKYMGAINGRWKNGKLFDRYPGNVLDYGYDISAPYVPASTRNRFWDAGLVWPLRINRDSYFIPAWKTVYNDDTSVLNSVVTVKAICYLHKILDKAWRHNVHGGDLTNGQLIDNVNRFVSERTQGIFDGRFVIVPDAQFTSLDELYGFTWTLPVTIYANNMKTVMKTHIIAKRMSDLGSS